MAAVHVLWTQWFHNDNIVGNLYGVFVEVKLYEQIWHHKYELFS